MIATSLELTTCSQSIPGGSLILYHILAFPLPTMYNTETTFIHLSRDIALQCLCMHPIGTGYRQQRSIRSVGLLARIVNTFRSSMSALGITVSSSKHCTYCLRSTAGKSFTEAAIDSNQSFVNSYSVDQVALQLAIF